MAPLRELPESLTAAEIEGRTVPLDHPYLRALVAVELDDRGWFENCGNSIVAEVERLGDATAAALHTLAQCDRASLTPVSWPWLEQVLDLLDQFRDWGRGARHMEQAAVLAPERDWIAGLDDLP